MKNLACILAFVAVILALVSSCKKDNVPVIEKTTPLTGKWKLNAIFLGIGPPPTWRPVTAGDNYTVVFNTSGSLGGNYYAQYYSYKVKDSLLTFNSAADGEARLLYTIRHDTLIMTPAPPMMCVEGCAVRFIKQ